jgi:sulfite exporter TauE/SafE
MIGSGLPLLLAPKDGGEQVIGLILASLGAVFQLQNLALVSWRLSQVWPILLVVAGLLMVSQALRQRKPSPSA